MSKKLPIVCYLFTGFDNNNSLTKFITNYKKYKSGYKHDLIICFKLIPNEKINYLTKKLSTIEHKLFIDPEKKNDWDFGSYRRVAKKYKNKIIFFMNSHSYPVTNNWLRKMMKHFKTKTIISSSGSYESITNQVKLKRPYNLFSFFKKKVKAKKSFFKFPNPHLNTSSFLIKSDDFLKFLGNRSFNNKYETWKIESGFNSLTNYFKRKKYKLLVINSDGKKFDENNWMFSETFYYKNQSKTLISDKHSRKYLKLDNFNKKKSQLAVWGI